MFGIKFIKAMPTEYIMKFKKGRARKQGAGQSFFFYAPTASIVLIPLASQESPFIMNEVTKDFQAVTVQGSVTFRIVDPEKISKVLNYTLTSSLDEYTSEDPDKLPTKIINEIQVIIRSELQSRDLRQALRTSEEFVTGISDKLKSLPVIEQLGIEIINFSVLAIKPNPETSIALEAEAREQLLREADEAIYTRRNAAVEQERAIKENELNTEIAVENKKREIREAKIEADRIAQQKQMKMKEEGLEGDIKLEKRNKDLVELKVKNRKEEADAKEYELTASLKAFKGIDPKVIQSLASVGMDPEQMIAAAFRGLAENSDKIGSLNITPDLLRELMDSKPEPDKKWNASPKTK
ncbi:MAG: SPFH domain-containing protein [Acidobacteria bacterium]|nr:SPFH domain-containing protein [Acidobacteriota bacterium]